MLDLREYFLTVLKEATLAASDCMVRAGMLGSSQKVRVDKQVQVRVGIVRGHV